MTIVLDTNVLVSALLSPFRASARLLDLVLSGDLRLAFDDRVLAEYRDVLVRSKFEFDRRAVDDLLAYIENTGIAVSPSPLVLRLPDPDDIIFLEVAIAVQATLVTRNLRHFPTDQRKGVVIMTPREFLEFWSSEAK